MKRGKSFKWAVFAFMMVLLVSIVSAGIVDELGDNIAYYSYDADNISGDGLTIFDLSIGDNNLTYNDNLFNRTGKLNEAYGFDGSSSQAVIETQIISAYPFTMCTWVNTTDGSNFNSAMDLAYKSADNVNYGIGIFGNQSIIYARNAGALQFSQGGATFGDGEYHFICGIFRNSTDKEMFLDGVSVANLTNIVSYSGLVDRFQIGRLGDSTPTNYWNGNIDESSVWNRSLNQTEIDELYDSGNGFNPYTPVTPLSFHKVKIINAWNLSNLANVNVTLNNSDWNITDSDGIAQFNNLSGNFDFNATLTDYFNITGLAIENTTVNYNMSQTQVNISFNFSSGDLVFTSINLTALDIGESYNVTNDSIILYPNAGFINFSVVSDINLFASFNFTLNLSALDNSSFDYIVNETHNVITFLDENTSNPIENATIIVTFPSSFTLNLSTNSSGQINFSYIQNNTLEFGDYSYYFDKVGYVNITLADVINESNIPHTRTYNLSRAKLNIFIYDRVTGNLLNGTNVSIAFIGLFNDTTDTGTLIKDNLTIVGGDYLIYASAGGYKTSIRSLTFTNQEEFTLNFYLLNLSEPNAGTLFVTTKDSFFRDITGAKVDLLEYIPSSLSYISVDSCVSNVNAECSFAVELNTKVYYIRATSIIDGTVFVAETSQNGEIFTVNNDIRNLIFFTRSTFSISTSTNLIYSIDENFINNISSISVDFFTSDGTAKEVCVEYFILTSGSWVSVTGDTYCLLSSNALQNIDVDVTLNRSNTYEARIYVKESFDNILKTYDYPNESSASSIFDNDFKAIFIMIFWLFALGYALHQKNITVFFFLGIVISWVEVILFPIFSMVGISVFKTIVCLICIYVARKKQDFQ